MSFQFVHVVYNRFRSAVRMTHWPSAVVLGLALFAFASLVIAGGYSNNFNSSLRGRLFGDARRLKVFLDSNEHIIALTFNQPDQLGGFSVNSLDAINRPVQRWIAEFNLQNFGNFFGRAADGWSLNFSRLGQVGAASENGIGTGVSISFDTFHNGGESASTNDNLVKISSGGRLRTEIGNLPFALPTIPTFDDGRFHTVRVELDRVNSSTANVRISFPRDSALGINVNIPWTEHAGQFVFGARSGGLFAMHSLDDVVLQTFAPNISASGTPDFGNVLVGNTATRNVSVFNNGHSGTTLIGFFEDL